MKQPFAIWITGLPASGKSTLRGRLVDRLRARGIDVAVLESDLLREVLGGGYDDAGRDRFYRSMVWIGELLTGHGVPVIFDATANRRAYRDEGRRRIPKFFEVFVDTPLGICMERDPKGIYRRGRQDPAGTVPGVQAAYEPPLAPEVRIDGRTMDPDRSAEEIVSEMTAMGFLISGVSL